jgi:hypothetical protein
MGNKAVHTALGVRCPGYRRRLAGIADEHTALRPWHGISDTGGETMIRISKESKLVPSGFIKAAMGFFGPPGIGMTVVDEDDCCVRLEGFGGYVFVQTEDFEDKKGSQVIIEGREFEYQIKEFLARI